MPHDDAPAIKLSTGTWIKIIGFLLLHGGAIVVAAWSVTQSYENRLTALETNQKLLMKIYMRQFGVHPDDGGGTGQ